MKNRRMLNLFFLLMLLIMGLIWTQSLQPQNVSGAQSGMIMGLLRPLLDPQGRIPEETFHYWVRKSAHFIEFLALGLSAGGFCVCLGKERQRRFLALPVLICLAVAVMDEYIQFFSGRGSAVADIVLDFSGAVTGLTLIVLGCLVKNRGRR